VQSELSLTFIMLNCFSCKILILELDGPGSLHLTIFPQSCSVFSNASIFVQYLQL
jgi:hypothetical protein